MSIEYVVVCLEMIKKLCSLSNPLFWQKGSPIFFGIALQVIAGQIVNSLWSGFLGSLAISFSVAWNLISWVKTKSCSSKLAFHTYQEWLNWCRGGLVRAWGRSMRVRHSDPYRPLPAPTFLHPPPPPSSYLAHFPLHRWPHPEAPPAHLCSSGSTTHPASRWKLHQY